jgi:YegS/Rv2252/BmrU family lipid kinase
VIVNPTAGKGRNLDKLDRIKSEFIARSVPYDLYFTTEQRKADSITHELLQNNPYSDILILGGDGTINEVANGLGRQRIPLSVISFGTGNDTIKHVQQNLDFGAQLHAAFEGQIIQIDAGSCNGRLFLNGVGIGFDGKVVERMAAKGKKFQGYVSYLAEVLSILLTYREKEIRANFNGHEFQEKVLLMTIAKGTTFGGGFMINPYAHSNDGLLDICVIGKIPKWMRINYVLKMKKGGHRHLGQVSFYKSRELLVDKNPFVVAHMDGEFIGNPPFYIKVLPQVISFRI